MSQWLIPLTVLIFFEFVADMFAKHWSLRGGFWLATCALVSYVLANTFWLFALKNGSGLGRGAMIFSLISAIVAVVLGVFLYQEKVSTSQIIGITLGLVSLVFIFWE